MKRVLLEYNSISIKYLDEIKHYLKLNRQQAMEAIKPKLGKQIRLMRGEQNQFEATCKSLESARMVREESVKKFKRVEDKFEH